MKITIREAARRLYCRPDTLRKDVKAHPAWFGAEQQANSLWLIETDSPGYRAWAERTPGNPGRRQWGGYRPRKPARASGRP